MWSRIFPRRHQTSNLLALIRLGEVIQPAPHVQHFPEIYFMRNRSVVKVIKFSFRPNVRFYWKPFDLPPNKFCGVHPIIVNPFPVWIEIFHLPIKWSNIVQKHSIVYFFLQYSSRAFVWYQCCGQRWKHWTHIGRLGPPFQNCPQNLKVRYFVKLGPLDLH